MNVASKIRQRKADKGARFQLLEDAAGRSRFEPADELIHHIRRESNRICPRCGIAATRHSSPARANSGFLPSNLPPEINLLRAAKVLFPSTAAEHHVLNMHCPFIVAEVLTAARFNSGGIMPLKPVSAVGRSGSAASGIRRARFQNVSIISGSLRFDPRSARPSAGK